MTVRALTLDIRVGESVAVGRGVTLTLEEKSGQRARVRFLADESVTIRKVGVAPKTGAEMAKQGINAR